MSVSSAVSHAWAQIHHAQSQGRFQATVTIDLPGPPVFADWTPARAEGDRLVTAVVAALRAGAYHTWVEQWPTEVPPNFLLQTATLRVTW